MRFSNYFAVGDHKTLIRRFYPRREGTPYNDLYVGAGDCQNRVYHLLKSVPFTEKRPRMPEIETSIKDGF